MVLVKMSNNPFSHPSREKMTPRPSPLPQTSFENPILLSSPSSSEDEEEDKGLGMDNGGVSMRQNNTSTTRSSTSSHGDSTRSEKFTLTGDFSSDIYVSATSGSSDEEQSLTSQPLSNLRNLISKNKRSDSNYSAIMPDKSMVMLSDLTSSSSSDSSYNPSDSSSDESLSRNGPSTPLSYIVNVPLNKINLSQSKTNTNTPPLTGMKGKRPLALSHFATVKKRAVNDASKVSPEVGVDPVLQQLKPPLALKLTKSPTGNSWHSMISPPQANPPSFPSVSPTNAILEKALHSKKKTSPQKRKSLSPVKSHSPSLPLSDFCMERRRAHADARLLIESHLMMEDDLSSVTSNSSLITNSSNSNGHVRVVTPSTPQPTPTSQITSSTKPSNKSRGKLKGKGSKTRHYHKRNNGKQQTSIKDIKSTICFEKLFGSFSPSLRLVEGELQPVHSLSLKSIAIAPSNHPIHNWRIGKTVPKSKQKVHNCDKAEPLPSTPPMSSSLIPPSS